MPKKNRGQLDSYLYNKPNQDQLNPEYSLYTDQNTYYLSWNNRGDNLRIKSGINEYDPENLPSKERFYEHVEQKVFNDLHFKPTHNGRDFIRYSSYDLGEGYGSKVRQHTSIPFTLTNIYIQGSKPKVKIRYTGNSSNHFIETKINDLILNKFNSNGYRLNDFETEFNSSHLSENLNIDIIGNKGNNDRHSVATVKLTYPRAFDFRGQASFTFQLGKSFIPRYLEIANFNHSDNIPILIDIQNHEIYKPLIDNGVVKVVIPASVAPRKLLLINPSKAIRKVVHFSEFQKNIIVSTIGNYLIISNRKLYDDGNGKNWVNEYAEYRQSFQGGMYDVTIIDVNDIYEHYGYGISEHSISIKNFINHLQNQNHILDGILIIGKGLEYPLLRKKSELKTKVECFVPTYGSPGGDNLFVTKGKGFLPQIPIGRLAAQSPQEVKNYLQKVKAYESPVDHTDDQSVLRRKKVLHLSGGSADIQELLFGYLSDMKNVIESNQFGAEVSTFREKNCRFDTIVANR